MTRATFAIALVAAGVLLTPSPARAACSDATIAMIESAARELEPSQAAPFVAGAIARSCGDMPLQNRRALELYEKTPADARWGLIPKMLDMNGTQWKATCEDGDALLRPLSKVQLLDERRALWKSCHLAWLASDAELARGGPGVELALLVHPWLMMQERIPPQRVRRIMRVLAGFDQRTMRELNDVAGPRPPENAPSRDHIRWVVRHNLNEVRFCYKKALIDRPTLQGKVTVRFTLGSDGKVTQSEVQSSTLGAPDVEGCIAAAPRRWSFPASPTPQTIVYPFELKPIEPPQD